MNTQQTGKDGQGFYYVQLQLFTGTPDAAPEGNDTSLPFGITYSGGEGWYYIRVYTAAGGVDGNLSYDLRVTYP